MFPVVRLGILAPFRFNVNTKPTGRGRVVNSSDIKGSSTTQFDPSDLNGRTGTRIDMIFDGEVVHSLHGLSNVQFVATDHTARKFLMDQHDDAQHHRITALRFN